MSATSAYSPRMNTNAQPAPAASAAIAMPSISWCGFFCISSRSATRLNSNRVSGTFRLLHAGVWVGLGAAGRREVGQRLVRQHLGAGAELLDRRARVIGVQGPVVAPVDRGHRGDVAGPQAL